MRRFLIGCGAFLVVAVGAGIAWRVWPESHVFLTDAGSIKEPVATALPRDILWQPPTPLLDILNTTQEDYEPRISADGLTLYFVRGKAGHNADIFVSRRTHESWTPPEPLAEVNSEADDLGASPSADGLALYFYSNREGGQGGYDLWVSRRGSSGWLEPTNLGPAVNSEFNEYGPALTGDGGILYFSSNRPQPKDLREPNPNAWPATLREDFYHRTYDLYSSTITDHGVHEAVALDLLNTPFNEGAPAVSPFGDFIYFASDRPGGVGGFDLYRSRRIRGEHQSPTNLGVVVNTTANELDPALAMGGYALYFSSDQTEDRTPIAGEKAPSASREYNLYETTSREVFTEVDTVARPPIDWAALWSVIGPNLLWALLALLLLLLMLALFKSAQNRKLSLLAKCLLASLAAHLLLMLLFNVWDVAASIAGEFARNGRGPIQIALFGPESGDALTSQIRGNLTDLQNPPSVEIQTQRFNAPAQTEVQQPIVQTMTERSEMTPTENSLKPFLPIDLQPQLLLAALPQTTVPSPTSLPHLETALPAETTPTHVTEAQNATVPAPVAAPRPDRPGPSAPNTPSARAVLQPTETDRSAALSSTHTFIESAAPREASPQRDASVVPQVRPTDIMPPTVSAEAKTTLALALPITAPDSMPAQEQEQLRTVVPQSTLSPRAATAHAVGVAVPAAAVSIVPSASQGGANDSQFASVLGSRAREAAPRATAAVPTQFVSNPPPSASSTEIALPNLEARVLPTGSGSTFTSKATSTATGTGTGTGAKVDVGSLRAPIAGLSSPSAKSAFPARIDAAPAAQGTSTPFNERPGSLMGKAWSQREAQPPETLGFASMNATPERTPPSSLELDLTLPAEETSPDNPYAGGFSEKTEQAVALNGESLVVGTIRGVVTDAASHKPLARAAVRLDLPDRPPVTAITERDGTYMLNAPEVPDFFALSASRKRYVPKSVNVERARMEGRTLKVDFALEAVSKAVLVTEAVPDVHHLGDNHFEGTINSQFQKKSEGSQFSVEFQLPDGQVAAELGRAEVRLLAKGVQREHRVVINGTTLKRRLNQAPEDGGFGEFIAPFDASLLQPGTNTLQIIAAPSDSDIDDFEFVNVQIRLKPSVKEPATTGNLQRQ